MESHYEAKINNIQQEYTTIYIMYNKTFSRTNSWVVLYLLQNFLEIYYARKQW